MVGWCEGEALLLLCRMPVYGEVRSAPASPVRLKPAAEKNLFFPLPHAASDVSARRFLLCPWSFTSRASPSPLSICRRQVCGGFQHTWDGDISGLVHRVGCRPQALLMNPVRFSWVLLQPRAARKEPAALRAPPFCWWLVKCSAEPPLQQSVLLWGLSSSPFSCRRWVGGRLEH